MNLNIRQNIHLILALRLKHDKSQMIIHICVLPDFPCKSRGNIVRDANLCLRPLLPIPALRNGECQRCERLAGFPIRVFGMDDRATGKGNKHIVTARVAFVFDAQGRIAWILSLSEYEILCRRIDTHRRASGVCSIITAPGVNKDHISGRERANSFVALLLQRCKRPFVLRVGEVHRYRFKREVQVTHEVVVREEDVHLFVANNEFQGSNSSTWPLIFVSGHGRMSEVRTRSQWVNTGVSTSSVGKLSASCD